MTLENTNRDQDMELIRFGDSYNKVKEIMIDLDTQVTEGKEKIEELERINKAFAKENVGLEVEIKGLKEKR